MGGGGHETGEIIEGRKEGGGGDGYGRGSQREAR